MLQPHTTTQWLLEGFKYDLEITLRPRAVEYYCGHMCRFERWARTAGIPSDIRLIRKRDIQAFFHHLAITSENSHDSNGIEQHRWPYYRALRRFFEWAVKEGYLKQSPMDGMRFKAPQAPPVEPYRPEHIDQMLKVLDHRWKVATTPRQKMMSARDRAILLPFLESGLRLGELAALTLADIDLERQRVTVWCGKLGKSRPAGFGPQIKRALWKYLGLRGAVETNALWLTEGGMIRVAVYTVKRYWYERRKYARVVSLNSVVDDGEGNEQELIDTLADDKAIDLEAWVDARMWIRGCRQRLVEIAHKRVNGVRLTSSEQTYLSRFRKREQKRLL